DLDGDHLEDARGAPPQRSALLEFDAARHRPEAEAARQAADIRCVEAWLLPHRNVGDPAAALFDGDAPSASPHRARQARRLLSEGRLENLVGISRSWPGLSRPSTTFLLCQRRGCPG